MDALLAALGREAERVARSAGVDVKVRMEWNSPMVRAYVGAYMVTQSDALGAMAFLRGWVVACMTLSAAKSEGQTSSPAGVPPATV